VEVGRLVVILLLEQLFAEVVVKGFNLVTVVMA
jgi:hypothetical protein